jgi:hypothetical protein
VIGVLHVSSKIDTNPETIAPHVTVIGGQRYADDCQVIWRGMPSFRLSSIIIVWLHRDDERGNVGQSHLELNFFGNSGLSGNAGVRKVVVFRSFGSLSLKSTTRQISVMKNTPSIISSAIRLRESN